MLNDWAKHLDLFLMADDWEVLKFRFFYNWDMKQMYRDKTGNDGWSYLNPKGSWAENKLVNLIKRLIANIGEKEYGIGKKASRVLRRVVLYWLFYCTPKRHDKMVKDCFTRIEGQL